VIGVILAIWLIASIVAQFWTGIRRFDFIGIIPSYRFFAPRPVSRDIQIYFRGFGKENPGPWMPVWNAEKPWYCFIWNPAHRIQKTLYDIYEDLEPYRESPQIWHTSLPYLVLLNVATARLASNRECDSVQFMIACYAGHEDPTHDVLFLSNRHDIG
jgi:hypothetical protein